MLLRQNVALVLSAIILVTGAHLVAANPLNPQGIIHRGGHITNFERWSADNIYVIDDHVTIDVGATLLIEPGTIVKFAPNKLLGVDGILKVGDFPSGQLFLPLIVGSSASTHLGAAALPNRSHISTMSGALPVYFTSLLDDTLGGDTNGDGNTTSPNPGDWGHIAFFDTSVDAQNVLDQALIRYGGHFDSGNRDYYDCFSCDFWGAIRLQAASPTVRNTTIEQNLGYTFSADINSYPTLQNNTLTTNGGNGLEIRGGTFAAGLPAIRHWSTTDTAYALTGHVTVPSGVTLIIDPGVVVKFGDNRLLGVNGVLKIQGTSGNPVTLTSLKDDTLKGDTNGDGNATAPAAGSWGHVAFFDTSVDSENLIEYALIRYGGHFDSGNRDYYDCFSCDFWGAIRLDAASPTVQYSAITSNQTGLRLLTNAQPDVLNNAIYDNQDYGLYNEDTLHPVTATGNWWGHSSGPYHATNASGQGNPVSDYVDFDPWLPSSPISLP